MGKHERRQKERLAPFVPVLKDTLDAPAWKAMSFGARMLFIALKRRYNQNNHNNGRLFISQRDASVEMGTHHNEVARWFRELQHFGFIAQTSAGALGVDGRGKAPHWRLTELGYMNQGPTRDFAGWKGEPFKNTKTESRAGNGARGVPGMAHTTVLEMAHGNGNKCAGKGAHTAPEAVPEKAHILSIPLPTSHPAFPAASPELLAVMAKKPRWQR